MIGNDVVDLGDPEARSGALHRRFDERVFSLAERALLARSERPDRERWVLWAAKEAAYKLTSRGDPSVSFSPSRFEVGYADSRRAQVRWRGSTLPVELRFSGEAIHAIARRARETDVVSAIRCDGLDDPSSSVRALAVETLAPWLGAAPGDLGVAREPGRPPVLLLRGRPMGGALSLSHHGRFVAFAYASSRGTGGSW